MTAAVLVFAWGNPSRGDDALGPLFTEQLDAMRGTHPRWGELECLTDFQLQIEHALDLQGRSRILFVDASIECAEPYAVSRVEPMRDASFSTHAMTPQALLQVYCQVHREPPPPTWQMAIRGVRFELGDDLSDDARRNLEAALAWAAEWLGKESAEDYNSLRVSHQTQGLRIS